MKANNPAHRVRCAKIKNSEIVSGTLVLALLFVSGCLELKSHKRSPDTDTEHLNNCSGVSCWDPPHNTCFADEALQVYAPSGYCSGGKCAYATREEQCRSGLCEARILSHQRGHCRNQREIFLLPHESFTSLISTMLDRGVFVFWSRKFRRIFVRDNNRPNFLL